MNSIDYKEKYIKYKKKYLIEKNKYLEQINGGSGFALAENPSYNKRLDKEMRQLKETFPQSIVTRNNQIVSVVYNGNTFTIELPERWPFQSPIFRINGLIREIPSLINNQGYVGDYGWGPARELTDIISRIIQYLNNPAETLERWDQERVVLEREKRKQAAERRRLYEERRRQDEVKARQDEDDRQAEIAKFNNDGILPKGQKRLEKEIENLKRVYGEENVKIDKNVISINNGAVNYTIVFTIDFIFGDVMFRNNITGEEYTEKIHGKSLDSLIRK